MRAFEVKVGTEAQVIQDGKEWRGQNFQNFVTTKDNLFFLEDIVVDPFGKVGCGPQHAVTIGGSYASAGYYGFLRDGWILLVPMSRVIVH